MDLPQLSTSQGLAKSGPRVGSVDVQKDDCGSAPVPDLLSTGDTSSGMNTSSSTATSSCDSQNDLVSLPQAGGLVLTTSYRPSLLPTYPEDDYICSQLDTAESIDECRHHGGDIAAVALLDESSRRASLDMGAGLHTYSISSQSICHIHGPKSPNQPEASACDVVQFGSLERHGWPCTRRLSVSTVDSDAPEQPNKCAMTAYNEGAFTRSSRCIYAGADRLPVAASAPPLSNSWSLASALSENGTHTYYMPPYPVTRTVSLPRAAMHVGSVPASATSLHSKSSRLLLSPGDKLVIAAAVSLTTPHACLSTLALESPREQPGPLPVTTATGDASPTVAAADADAAVAHPTILELAIMDDEFVGSPFARCTTADDPSLPDHELPDDSVHGGRPRHPLLTASAHSSMLLEWAESESAVNCLHPLHIGASVAVGRASMDAQPAAPDVMEAAGNHAALESETTDAAAAPGSAVRLLPSQLQRLLRVLQQAPGAWAALLPTLAQRLRHVCMRLPLLLLLWIAVLRPLATKARSAISVLAAWRGPAPRI